jgi:hypothetical protein
MSTVTGGSNYASGPPLPPEHYAQTVGDGVTTTFAITHNLGTLDTMNQAYNPITGVNIAPTAYTATHTSPNVLTVVFTTAPAAGAARFVVDA